MLIGFRNLEEARTALGRLRTLDWQGRIRIADAAIIECDESGGGHIRNEVSGTAAPAGSTGAAIGGLLATVGIGVGADQRAGSDSSNDDLPARGGADRAVADGVRRAFAPGRSVLLTLVDAIDREAALAAVRDLRDRVFGDSP